MAAFTFQMLIIVLIRLKSCLTANIKRPAADTVSFLPSDRRLNLSDNTRQTKTGGRKVGSVDMGRSLVLMHVRLPHVEIWHGFWFAVWSAIWFAII